MLSIMFLCVYPRFPIVQTLAYVLIKITVAALIIIINNITPNPSQNNVFLSLV
jgi:hypothetical protein